MKPEYWDAIWLGLAIGFTPLVIGLTIFGIWWVGMWLVLYATCAWEWVADQVHANG